MPKLDITFANFDTVCYSNQHNIIELIKNMVGVSVEINLNIDAIEELKNQEGGTSEKVDQAIKDAEAALEVSKNLNQAVSHNSYYIEQQEELTSYFWNTKLGRYITELEDRVKFDETIISGLEDRVLELEKKVGTT